MVLSLCRIGFTLGSIRGSIFWTGISSSFEFTPTTKKSRFYSICPLILENKRLNSKCFEFLNCYLVYFRFFSLLDFHFDRIAIVAKNSLCFMRSIDRTESIYTHSEYQRVLAYRNVYTHTWTKKPACTIYRFNSIDDTMFRFRLWNSMISINFSKRKFAIC